MRRLIGFLLGAVSGALIGATVAILVAPYSGEELRSELRSRVNRFREEIQGATQQRRAELEKQLHALRQPHAEIPLEER
jgi:gas vesicle protein